MVRMLRLLIFGCVVLVLAGCGGGVEEPIWERVKIGDLRSAKREEGSEGESLKNIGFRVYSFKLPAKAIGLLDEIWGELYTEPIRFKDREVFEANLFSSGIGDIGIWERVGELLRGAGGRRIEEISVLLSEGERGYFTVSRLREERAVFYISEEGRMEEVTIGPGGMVLGMEAEKVAGSRGLCRVEAVPVFLPRFRRLADESEGGKIIGEFVFRGCGFGFNISPGEFVFLGPKRYVSEQLTLGSMFFNVSEKEVVFIDKQGRRKTGREAEAFRVFLLVCTDIID